MKKKDAKSIFSQKHELLKCYFKQLAWKTFYKWQN